MDKEKLVSDIVDKLELYDSGEYISVLSEKDNIVLLDQINKSSPSDLIKLTRASDLIIMDLWKENRNDISGIPSDLFFSATIPLRDCEICIDERDYYGELGIVTKCRVVVFEDYAERIRNTAENKLCSVAVLLYSPDANESGYLLVPLCVVRGINYLVIKHVIGYRGINSERRKEMTGIYTTSALIYDSTQYLETWYGIQISLLHPQIKDYYLKANKVQSITTTKSNRIGKTRKVKYVKEHILNADVLEEMIYGVQATADGEKRNIKRRALSWYVIGHWRNYKNGKKTFVQPYWKGTMREYKMKTENRERVIAQVIEPKIKKD